MKKQDTCDGSTPRTPAVGTIPSGQARSYSTRFELLQREADSRDWGAPVQMISILPYNFFTVKIRSVIVDAVIVKHAHVDTVIVIFRAITPSSHLNPRRIASPLVRCIARPRLIGMGAPFGILVRDLGPMEPSWSACPSSQVPKQCGSSWPLAHH